MSKLEEIRALGKGQIARMAGLEGPANSRATLANISLSPANTANTANKTAHTGANKPANSEHVRNGCEHCEQLRTEFALLQARVKALEIVAAVPKEKSEASAGGSKAEARREAARERMRAKRAALKAGA